MSKKPPPIKQLLDWNNEPLKIGLQVEGNPCVAEYGAGPPDRRCGECSHLVGIAMAKTYYKCDQRQNTHSAKTDHSMAKTYYKCDQRQNTHSAKTDHRRKWPACARFEERQGDMRLYDGR